MTTIVVDIENKKLYTDGRSTRVTPRRVTMGRFPFKSEAKESVYSNHTSKVRSVQYENGQYKLITGSGVASKLQEYTKKLIKGKAFSFIPPWKYKPVDCSLLEICFGSGDLRVTGYDSRGKLPLNADWYVGSGSGSEFLAKGVEEGLSIKQAFERAVLEDPYSGGKLFEWDISGRWWDEDKC